MTCPRRRILLVARHLAGGIRTYLGYTYRAFPPTDYSLAVIAVEGGEEQYLRAMLPDFEIRSQLVPKDRATARLALAVRHALRSGRFDLLHSQGLTAGVAACLGNLAVRVPHVVTHHGVFAPDELAGAKGQAMRRLLPLVLKGADRLVLVTEDSLRNLLEGAHGFHKMQRCGKLRVIPSGIDTRPFSEVRRARACRASGPIARLGFMGRFMPEKGFDTLIEAVRLLSARNDASHQFAIRCNNEGAFIREYRQKIAGMGIEDYFEFRGLRASVATVLTELDAVLMPSRWEAAGLLAMEALTAGCPLLASDCIGLREVTARSAAIVVRGNNPVAWADAIAGFLEDRTSLEERARDYGPVAEHRYSVLGAARGLEETFHEVLNSRQKRRWP